MDRFCLKSKDAHIEWPSDKFLDRFSEAIRRSASLYDRGGDTIWDCVKVLENRRRSLNLRERIEDLVGRARKLYLPEPRALQIHKQALEGSETSQKCFEALQECFEGKRQLASIKWEAHWAILTPRPTLRESCETRAAQICIDWLRWTFEVERPATPLVFWLMRIGNPDLLKALGYSRIDPFARIRLKRKETKLTKAKARAAIRQQRSRLRKDRLALSRSLRSERHGLHEIVRQELKIIDSRNSTKNERLAATERLIQYTRRTPDEWRRFFVRKA